MPSPLVTWSHIYLYPLIATLLLWGGLTVGLLWLNQRGERSGRLALLLLLPGVALAHHYLWQVRDDTSAWGMYSAFVVGMLIWTWHELAFYSGVLTGPWRTDCPPDAQGWRRFGIAVQTHIYHEAAVLIEVILLCWLHWGAPNMIALLTFVLMWTLQHSAKLNVLLGVRHLHVHLLPPHLRYLGTFWQQRAGTPFFGVSVSIASLLALGFWARAGLLAPSSEAIGMALLATLTTLGVLEHWLLVLPPSSSQHTKIRTPAAPSESARWNPDR